MKRTWILFAAHVMALLFGLGGILIAVPNPHLWADSEYGARVFELGMKYGGATHIIFGALTMLAFGVIALGWKRTLTFAGLAIPISLGAELIGTSTGWPFGNYAYTSGLGWKVLDHVPFTIPLSWFYVGFASYLLGLALARRLAPRLQSVAAVLIGVYLLVVWDLVLDPAMAHEDLPLKFWEWSQTGPYFGMPLINFAGWALTGIIFVSLARLIWGSDPAPSETPLGLPFLVYLANSIFAMALSLSVDLWQPVLISLAFGIVPAVLAWYWGRSDRTEQQEGAISNRVMVAGMSAIVRRYGSVTVEGKEHLPAVGPAVIVARHFHHLYDGCALQATTRRPVHILVALDWVRQPLVRRAMEAACGMARWPVILRPDGLERSGTESAYRSEEAQRYLHRGLRGAVDILKDGGILAVFPEAYPNVDPNFTPKQGTTDFLPFRPGFARIAALAERAGCRPVPLIPVGLHYEDEPSKRITVRLGEPVFLRDFETLAAAASLIERRVVSLSSPATASQPATAGRAVAS